MTNPFSKYYFSALLFLKLSLTLLVSLSVDKSIAQCCTYTLTMQDSYGDGWNGGKLKVFVNNTLQGEFYAINFGSSVSFEVCDHDTIRLTYAAGEYEEENSYQIYNSGWNVVFKDGPNPKVGHVISLTGDCSDVALAGKHPCVALPSEVNIEIKGNNQDFEGSGVIPPNCPNFVQGDVWYATEFLRSGNMEVSVHQLNDVTVHYAIWQGEECSNLRMVLCGSTDPNEKLSTVKVYDIPKGQKVYLQLWGKEEEKIQFGLLWKDLGRIILDGSELPVISINTLDQNIPYGDKINIKLNIKDNERVYYDGQAGINVRGASSSGYPQQPFSLETRDDQGENLDVSILGMPEENDWVLISNFNDRSLIRNTLAQHLFTQMDNYSPATRLCEVLIDSSYKGIYVLTEKIKRDKNRVNIAKLDPEDTSGDQLTGGYILQQNLRGDNNSFQSNFSPIDHPDLDVHFLYEYPDAETINSAQKTYIAGFIDSLETRLYSNTFADPVQGYRKFLDVPSFIDYFLVNELSRNADGFKKSIFYNKDRFSKGNKLKAGPVWDFDWAWKNLGICYLYDNFNGAGWAHLNNDCGPDNNSSGWYVRMLQDSTFANELHCTYQQYRKTIFDTAYIFNYIDSVHRLVTHAHVRHFDRWRTLGISGPAPEIGAIATTYAAELDTLKAWINTRIKWLDQNIPGNCAHVSSIQNNSDLPDLFKYFPNPTSGMVKFSGRLEGQKNHELNFYNTMGQLIDKVHLTTQTLDFNYQFSKKGIYYFTITTQGMVNKSGKIVIW